MAERSAHLVDRVLRAELRWRQWVFTFPAELAVGLCFHADAAAAVLRICMRVLFAWLRSRSKVEGATRLHPAAVVQVQRHSDSAGVWYDIHVLCADGVFSEYADRLEVPFEAQRPPTDSDVAELVARVRARIHRYFHRQRAHADDPGQALLRRCADATAARVRTGTPASSKAPRSHLCAERAGFGLHAAVSVEPGRSAELERICRYLSRPPVPDSRLRRLEDGRIVLSLKRPRRGVHEHVFEPVAFVARRAALTVAGP